MRPTWFAAFFAASATRALDTSMTTLTSCERRPPTWRRFVREGGRRRPAASSRTPARHPEGDGGDREERAAADNEEYRARVAMVQELAEDDRRHHAADVKAGGHEAEHLAERAGRRDRAHDHIARRHRQAVGEAAQR